MLNEINPDLRDAINHYGGKAPLGRSVGCSRGCQGWSRDAPARSRSWGRGRWRALRRLQHRAIVWPSDWTLMHHGISSQVLYGTKGKVGLFWLCIRSLLTLTHSAGAIVVGTYTPTGAWTSTSAATPSRGRSGLPPKRHAFTFSQAPL